MTLPAAGRWALGLDAQVLAEALVAEAQGEGLRTGWLANEAGFLSNLNIIENLRLLYEWHGNAGSGFEAALAAAVAQLQLPAPDWLASRPSQLAATPLLHARFLRLLILRPDLVLLHPDSLAQAGTALVAQLVAGLAGARLLLLAEPAADWPAWPPVSPAQGAAPTGSAEDSAP